LEEQRIKDITETEDRIEQNTLTVEGLNEEMKLLNPHALGLQTLWTYKCELSRGRQVNAISWNNQDPVHNL
jgi:hypothetical protein